MNASCYITKMRDVKLRHPYEIASDFKTFWRAKGRFVKKSLRFLDIRDQSRANQTLAACSIKSEECS
jgi:hypothetical protein